MLKINENVCRVRKNKRIETEKQRDLLFTYGAILETDLLYDKENSVIFVDLDTESELEEFKSIISDISLDEAGKVKEIYENMCCEDPLENNHLYEYCDRQDNMKVLY